LDLVGIGRIGLDWACVSNILSIVIIDVILAGDNAVVIAMAVRDLPSDQRRKGIVLGAASAVFIRIVLTFFVSRILQIQFLKLAGGLVILWIAVKLLAEPSGEHEAGRRGGGILRAVWMILVADLTMSTDNMLAVAGASHGNLFLLVFGLALSIPFVVFASNLLSVLIGKYPVILYFGAAVLGRVGGEMILSDPAVFNLVAPTMPTQYAVQASLAVGVVVSGRLWMRWMMQDEAASSLCMEKEVSIESEEIK
jgi:YjbE family integral membrane protein